MTELPEGRPKNPSAARRLALVRSTLSILRHGNRRREKSGADGTWHQGPCRHDDGKFVFEVVAGTAGNTAGGVRKYRVFCGDFRWYTRLPKPMRLDASACEWALPRRTSAKPYPTLVNRESDASDAECQFAG